MKKLLKSDICGCVNSVRMHCLRLKSQPLRLKKKKKKAETRIAANADPNPTKETVFCFFFLEKKRESL